MNEEELWLKFGWTLEVADIMLERLIPGLDPEECFEEWAERKRVAELGLRVFGWSARRWGSS